ncbi:hypothetical protein ACHAW6_014288 [Cyclotella cf. meneghiniana]
MYSPAIKIRPLMTSRLEASCAAAAGSTTSASTSKLSTAIHEEIARLRDIICFETTQTSNGACPASTNVGADNEIVRVRGYTKEKHLHEIMQWQQHYYPPMLRYTIDEFKCEHCKQNKLFCKDCGLQPELERENFVPTWLSSTHAQFFDETTRVAYSLKVGNMHQTFEQQSDE